MKRLRKSGFTDYNTNYFWAKNIRTDGLVKVKVVDNNYDDYNGGRCEVKYLGKNYIVQNYDLITLADYDSFVNFAEENNISFDEAEQAMISGMTIDQFKQQYSK